MKSKRSTSIAMTIVAVAAVAGISSGIVAANIRDSSTPDAADKTEAPSGMPPSTSPASSGSSGDGGDLLYVVDNVIHDGATRVSYQPQFQSHVAAITRTGSGWLVFERFGASGSRLVLVDGDGDTIPIEADDPHSYAVSLDGDAVAVPLQGKPEVDIINPEDGTVIATLGIDFPDGASAVRFIEDELFLEGNDSGGVARIVRYDFSTDDFTPLDIAIPGQDATLEDVSPDGRYLVTDYLLASKSCVAAFDLRGSSEPSWTSCENSTSGPDSISPDGQNVVVSTSEGSSSTLTISDLETGDPVWTLEPSGDGYLLETTWVDSTSLLVVSDTDGTYSTFTIADCTVNGACEDLPDAGAENPSKDVTAGSTP